MSEDRRGQDGKQQPVPHEGPVRGEIMSPPPATMGTPQVQVGCANSITDM